MKKIAIPTRNEMVDNHFGHCEYYTIFSVDENNALTSSERLDSPQGCGCKSDIAQTLHNMGVTIMLAGNMGNGAYNKLSEQGINVLRGCSGSVAETLQNYLDGKLTDSAEACDHHDCDHHNNETLNVSNIKLAL